MAITIRRATVNDMICMQNANLHNLPENYLMKYYMYHILSWPEASFVATTTCIEDELEEHEDDNLSIPDPEKPGIMIKLDPTYVAPGEKLVG